MRRILLALLLAATAAPAAGQRLVIVGGLGGTTQHRDRFHEWATTLYEAARARGLSDEAIVFLAEDPDRDPRIDGPSTRDELEAALTGIAGSAGPQEPVTLVYLGHGSVRRGAASINLPGPDVTAADLDPLLAALAPRPVVFVNTAPASGGFLEELAGPERTLITATRTAGEQNETFFGGYFVEAFHGDDADADRDGRVSLLEAYQYARREVARRYETAGLILTEHALLDDTGDGVGSHEPAAAEPGGDGMRARGLFLSPAGAAEEETDDPVLRRLYAERAELEAAVRALQARKESMEPAAYHRELESLLVELALKSREIRQREGGG